MSESTPSKPSFRPLPGHNPRSRNDRHKRINYYVGRMGEAVSAELKTALTAMRANNPEIADKSCSEIEFQSATKELLCIYFHLEALDQGADQMPQWLLDYLKLALHASDQLIAEPNAASILTSHAQATDLHSLYKRASESLAQRLGFGPQSSIAVQLVPLLEESRPLRQKLLKESLTLDTILA